MSSRELVKKLDEMAARAYELAASLGEIVGWVSRTSPSRIDEEGGQVVFDVEPAVYFGKFADIAAGSVLVVVDIKTGHLISLKITAVERRDILAELELPDAFVSMPAREASGLLTKTAIRAKPLLAYDPASDSVYVANYAIEPQSPVIEPKNPRVVQRVLGLPTEGVFLGYVTSGDVPVFGASVPLFLPIKAFYQHVMVLGTTGSGKTTLLKNIISAMTSKYRLGEDQGVSVVVLDPNKDYVALPLPPSVPDGMPELEKRLYSEAGRNVKRPKGVAIVVPVTRDIAEKHLAQDEAWPRFVKRLCEFYIEDAIGGIARRLGMGFKIRELVVLEEPHSVPLRYAKAAVELGGEVAWYYVIPYSFRFADLSPRDFIALNPYFTRQAKDFLSRLLKKLEDLGRPAKTLEELYDSLRAARYAMEEKERWGTYGRADLVAEVVRDLAVHKSTLENVLRQLGSLLDTGLFDVGVGGEAGILREPPLGLLLERHFQLFEGLPIVVDLEFLQEYSEADPEKVIGIVAYRVLNNVFGWKLAKSREKAATQPVVIFVDEAHRFFPSKGGGAEEFIEHVSGMIDRVARLGRSRGLGIVFSTHSPSDVHDIIMQLTNTKIVLRMDKTQLSPLDLPADYKDFVVKASDRVAILKSHVLRLGYVTFRTPMPLAGHYDVSAI